MSKQRSMQFAKISTLAELRAAKERLDWDIQASEERITREVNDIKSKFTLSYALSLVLQKVGVSSSSVGLAWEGFKLAQALYKKVRSSR